MKGLKTCLQLICFVFAVGFIFTACEEPCSGVVCEGGTCSNGICVCDEGYTRKNLGCISIARLYMNVDSTASVMWASTDGNGNDNPTLNNVLFEFAPNPSDPFQFDLLRFGGFNGNDITFNVTPTNYSLIITDTVTTNAGNTYAVSGNRANNEVELSIVDQGNNYSHHLTFTTDH